MNSKENNPNNVQRIIYKEIRGGDAKKRSAKSNISDTGGGARDLRFRPHAKFLPVFERMFPKTETIRGNAAQVGEFCWANKSKTKAIVFRKDTNARPGELRIGQINKGFPMEFWPRSLEGIVLIIVQQADGSVWPYFTTLASLQNDNWDPAVSIPILEAFKNRRSKNVSVAGYIDYEVPEVFHNGNILF